VSRASREYGVVGSCSDALGCIESPAKHTDTHTLSRIWGPSMVCLDRKTSEIISRLLLLLNNHKIKYETILAQIRRN
jgi:hypothetical protein